MSMNFVTELRTAIARTLANEIKAYDLAKACVRFGLEDGTGEEAWAGKMRYVESRLDNKALGELLAIGDAVLEAYEGYKLHAFELKETLRLARTNGRRRITEITRRNLFDELTLMGCMWGKLDIHLFLGRLWPVDAMASHDPRHKTFGDEVWRHMVLNDDWSTPQLLGRLNAMQLSDEAFMELLERIVHPSVRDADEQKTWVEAINKHIARDREDRDERRGHHRHRDRATRGLSSDQHSRIEVIVLADILGSEGSLSYVPTKLPIDAAGKRNARGMARCDLVRNETISDGAVRN